MPSFLRHPHLHDDTLVLVAEDDVWAAPVDGGRAHRLTADEVPALEHQHLAARPGEVRGVDQPVVAAANHDHVVVGHGSPRRKTEAGGRSRRAGDARAAGPHAACRQPRLKALRSAPHLR